MDFEEWWEVQEELAQNPANEAFARPVWNAAYEQGAEDGLSVSYMAGLKDASSRNLPEGYALVPIKPSPRMIIDMAWWCRELSLSTGDLVEFWESMVKSAQELDDEH